MSNMTPFRPQEFLFCYTLFATMFVADNNRHYCVTHILQAANHRYCQRAHPLKHLALARTNIKCPVVRSVWTNLCDFRCAAKEHSCTQQPAQRRETRFS